MEFSQNEQNKLLDLVAIDRNIMANQQKKLTNSTKIKLEELKARLPGIEATKVDNIAKINELKKNVNKAELDVENISKRIEKDSQNLNSTQTNPKDLIQLQHEIDNLNLKKSELEEVELEVLSELEELEQKEIKLTKMLLDLNKEIDSLYLKLNDEIRIIDDELNSFFQSREKIVLEIDKQLIDLYEKIRKEHGIGAAVFANNICTSCQISISPAELVQIQKTPKEEIVRCDNCRCILVRN